MPVLLISKARISLPTAGDVDIRSALDDPVRQHTTEATGEPIKIKASKKIAFRPAKELKEAV